VQSAVNYEIAISPHDMLEEYMRVYGNGRSVRETLFPVSDLPIGRVATMTCNDGFYPEIARALALNGAEIITHPQMPDPFVSTGMWQAQNRSRALENLAYVLAPNRAELYSMERPKGQSPGRSHIVDFNGEVVAHCEHGGETIVSTTIYLDALRRRRQDPSWNFLSQLRTEAFRSIYDDPIYPANMFSRTAPRSRLERESTKAIEDFNRKRVFMAASSRPSKVR
jgi:predicted amidohydrolase